MAGAPIPNITSSSSALAGLDTGNVTTSFNSGDFILGSGLTIGSGKILGFLAVGALMLYAAKEYLK